MSEATSTGNWFQDPILPGIIRWHDGVTFTGLAGPAGKIFFYLQSTKGNRGLTEPFTTPNEALANPTAADLAILKEKLESLNGAFPIFGEMNSLWEVSVFPGSEIGWREWNEDPNYYVYWYGESSSDLFHKDHVIAVDFMFPGQVAGYIATLPVTEQPTAEHVIEEEPVGPVSTAPSPSNPDGVGWMVDPEDSRSMIYWNGDEWSNRVSLKQFINYYLDTLNLTMPKAWEIAYSHSRRDLAIIHVLQQMDEGPAWVRDPEADFFDLKVRWWDGEKYTDAVGADQAGWYTSPNNQAMLQWWNGSAWEEHFQDKEEIRLEEERRAEASAARTAFWFNLAKDTYKAYRGTPAERQRNKEIQRSIDQRSSDQWWENKRAERRAEAARQQEKFYRKANERRGW